MKIGVCGLGRVGLPLALVLQEDGGHDVVGYDIDPRRVIARLRDPEDHGEQGLGNLIAAGAERLRLAATPEELVAHAEVVFVVVQTLHGSGYGGETPMPAEPANFNYEHLAAAMGGLWRAAVDQRKELTIAVVSTVLPGTLRRGEPPRDGDRVRVVYNPALISLGSVVQDLVKPDFILVGADDPDAAKQVAKIWAQTVYPELLGGTVHHTSIESAELLKVTLNAYLSTKITFANALAQLCHAIPGADVDEVTDGLKLSRKALGPFGLTAGLGDGGPCRPRDVVALSWLAEQAELPVDPFTSLIRLRESQTQRLAWLTANAAIDHDLPVVVLGLAYKPGTHLGDGSPARLLTHYLIELGADPYTFDPVTDGVEDDRMVTGRSAVYVLAVPHARFLGFTYPPGSVVIDPHGVVKDQEAVTVVRVGRR